MSKTRISATVFFGGLLPVLAEAALDGSWPDVSLSGFLLLVGGLAVISLAVIGGQSMYRSRKNR